MSPFGDKTISCDTEWPTQDDLKKLPLDQPIKLCRIGWKANDLNQPITGIVLEFTSGVRSLPFQCAYARKNNDFEYETIDPSRTVKQISMFVVEFDFGAVFVGRLRLID